MTPIFDTLPKAIRAAIRFGTQLHEINLDRWAQSYATDPDKVRETWLHELTKETNAREVEGK